MGLWNTLKGQLSKGERVLVVWSREHVIEVVPCVIDPALRLVRDDETGRSWPKPEFDPKPLGKDQAFFAIAERIVPWPTREKPQYDVLDNGTKIEVTPEYLDQLARDSDTEAWLRGVRGMSLADRLTHLGAGAAIGMVATYFLLRLVGFTMNHGTSAGTVVTITNATANATREATSMILLSVPHALALLSHLRWFV